MLHLLRLPGLLMCIQQGCPLLLELELQPLLTLLLLQMCALLLQPVAASTNMHVNILLQVSCYKENRLWTLFTVWCFW